MIDLREGQALSEAVNTVCKEFNLTIDSKTTAIVGLLTTAGMIYVPRFKDAFQRIKAERQQQASQLNSYEQREPVVSSERIERPSPNLNNPPGSDLGNIG